MLHHAEYRAKYAENLRRELPRIPLVGGGTGSQPRPVGVPPVAGHGQDGRATSAFWAFAKAGKELADVHIGCESVEPYPLKYVETGEAFGVRELAPALDSPKLASALDSPNRGSAKKAASSRRTPKGAPRAPLPLSYRVEDKMRLAKDRGSLKVNDTLNAGGDSARGVRLPPGQSQRPRMGDRPIPGDRR